MPRPKIKGTQLAVRFEDELIAGMDVAAKTLNQSRTTIVQSAVQAFIRLSPEDQHEAVAAYLTRSLKQPAAKKGRTRG